MTEAMKVLMDAARQVLKAEHETACPHSGAIILAANCPWCIGHRLAGLDVAVRHVEKLEGK